MARTPAPRCCFLELAAIVAAPTPHERTASCIRWRPRYFAATCWRRPARARLFRRLASGFRRVRISAPISPCCARSAAWRFWRRATGGRGCSPWPSALAALWTTLGASDSAVDCGRRGRRGRARHLSPAAAQFALRQPDAGTRAVAHRPRPTGRRHARRAFRDGAARCEDLGDVPVPVLLFAAPGWRNVQSFRAGRFARQDRSVSAAVRWPSPRSSLAVPVQVGALHLRGRGLSTNPASWTFCSRHFPGWATPCCLPATSTPPHGARRCGGSKPTVVSPMSRASGRPGSTRSCRTSCAVMPACRSTRSCPRARSRSFPRRRSKTSARTICRYWWSSRSGGRSRKRMPGRRRSMLTA